MAAPTEPVELPNMTGDAATVQSLARAIVVAQASNPNSIAARQACSQNARVPIASRSRGRIARVVRSVLIAPQ